MWQVYDRHMTVIPKVQQMKIKDNDQWTKYLKTQQLLLQKIYTRCKPRDEPRALRCKGNDIWCPVS